MHPIATCTIWKSPATILPVESHPEKNKGVVQGNNVPVVRGIICNTVASVPKIVLTSGVNKNGIAIIGFNTTGSPKITISFIPKIPGTIDNFHNFFIRSDLPLKIISNTRDSVLPPPPKLQKKSENEPVNI